LAPQHEIPPLRRILLGAAEALVAVYVVLDDILTPVLRPVVRWVVTLPLVLRLQHFAADLPPYGILALMAVPFVLGEPAKLYGLYLMATGHLIMGAMVLGLAHLAVLLLVERLYTAGKAKLRTIRWFALAMDWLVDIRDKVHDWARKTQVWVAAERIMRQIRAAYPKVKQRALEAIEWLRLRLRRG
jgi:hypothetical protein